jgi:Fic-DOC domain mobile mystery protein B
MTDGSEWTPIPGETPIDPSGLKIKSVRTRDELNVVEARNILKATIKYLNARLNARVAPFDYDWALRLHAEMFGDVWLWAGAQRQSRTNLGCQPHLIPEQLEHLLGDIKRWTGYGVPMAEQAAMLHHRAVTIHPFENGNGRWSRLMANIWLHRAKQPIIIWPDATIGNTASDIREDYLFTLREADNGNYVPLIELQEQYLERR